MPDLRQYEVLTRPGATVARIAALEAEAARLREALQFYADPATWAVDAGRSRYIPRSHAERDQGEQAHAALKEGR